MYHGKHIRKSKRPVALLASLVMLLAVAVVGTAAFLTTSKGPVTNTFTPAHVPNKVVEEFNGSVKKDVAIKNEGDVPAYIRVALVATWVNDQGEVYGQQPVLGTNYTVAPEPLANDWIKSGDYYYYTKPVPETDGKNVTGVLFSKIKQKGDAPAGYSLSIEILSQSIQADGVDKDGNHPVELAWESATTAITVGDNGVLTISTPSGQ